MKLLTASVGHEVYFQMWKEVGKGLRGQRSNAHIKSQLFKGHFQKKQECPPFLGIF